MRHSAAGDISDDVTVTGRTLHLVCPFIFFGTDPLRSRSAYNVSEDDSFHLSSKNSLSSRILYVTHILFRDQYKENFHHLFISVAFSVPAEAKSLVIFLFFL